MVDLKTMPTACVCASDAAALGVIVEFRAQGLRVPADVSVTGLDDIALAGIFTPALSTVRQQRAEMGRRATMLLLELLSNEPGLNQDNVIDNQLIIRSSSSHPPSS